MMWKTPKVTLDLGAFKALASETRLSILRALDGKRMSLGDISRITNLHKVTLHEHLVKLTEAGFVTKIEREGHKWVYYKLSWKGACLLHPENTRIVILFSITFILLFSGIVGLIHVAQVAAQDSDIVFGSDSGLVSDIIQNPLLYVAIGCLILFVILMIISLWRFKINKTPKL